MRRPLIVAGLVLASLAGPTAAEPRVEAERIRAHLRWLASDAQQGRGTGQAGGDRAADYLAEQFASYGLKPAGENGGYFQKVPLVGISTLAETTFRLNGRALTNLQDYVVNNQNQQAMVELDAPIVFVGFGISAPEYQWDDYKEVDLHGKVALLFVNEPESSRADFFQGKALTYYGRWTYKLEETARRGAIATIIIHRTDLAAYDWEVVRNSWSSEKSYLQASGQPLLAAAAWIHYDVAERLARECSQDLPRLYAAAQSREFHPLTLPARLQAHLVSRIRPFSSRNVIAKLPGTEKPEEAVVYSAHYDHLGIRPEEKADPIYNGALDNASGCAVLLELARVFTPQARTLFFVSTTAEEQGLLGAAYLAQHPPLPLQQISLDLNFDMVPPWGEPEEVTAHGAERTTFWNSVQEAAGKMHLGLRPEAHPEAGLYYRMDHFSLAQQGVPGFSVSEGLKFRGHDLAWGQARMTDYATRCYHHGADEFQEKWDFAGLATFTRFSQALGIRAANQAELVQWRAGDEFEKARLK